MAAEGLVGNAPAETRGVGGLCPRRRASSRCSVCRVWISIASAYASLWAFSECNSFGSLRFPYSGGRAGVGRGSDLQGGSTDQVWEQRLRALELGMRQLQTSMQTLVDGVPLSGELPSGPSTAAHDRGWSGTDSGWSAGLARAPPRRDSRESACQDVADGIRRARQARGASQGGRETEQRSSRRVGGRAGGDGAALAPGDQVSRAAGRSSRSRRWRWRRPRWCWGSRQVQSCCFSQVKDRPEEFAGARLSFYREPTVRRFFAGSVGSESRGVQVHCERGRSHLQPFAGPIRNAWTLATIVDQLNNDQPEAAKATALLALASLDQAAIDQGNWLLASEFSMQPSPPFSAFSKASGTRSIGDEADENIGPEMDFCVHGAPQGARRIPHGEAKSDSSWSSGAFWRNSDTRSSCRWERRSASEASSEAGERRHQRGSAPLIGGLRCSRLGRMLLVCSRPIWLLCGSPRCTTKAASPFVRF